MGWESTRAYAGQGVDLSACAGRVNPGRARFDAEPVSDAGDVVEGGDDLVGVDDRSVIEALVAEWREVALMHRRPRE